MATFQYIAKDPAGNETRGQVEAKDRNAAIAAVRAQGLLPTALGEVKGGGGAAPAPKSGKKPAKAKSSKKGGMLSKADKNNIKTCIFCDLLSFFDGSDAIAV